MQKNYHLIRCHSQYYLEKAQRYSKIIALLPLYLIL